MNEKDYYAIKIQYAWYNSRPYKLNKLKEIGETLLKAFDLTKYHMKEIYRLNSDVKDLLNKREYYIEKLK